MGRPTKLTPELQDAMVKLLKAGNLIKVACDRLGISVSTYTEWNRRGERGHQRDTPYVAFLAAIKEARAEAIGEALANIKSAALEGSWQASAWYLERSFPQMYGRRVRDVNVSGGEKPVKVEVVWDIPPARNGEAEP